MNFTVECCDLCHAPIKRQKHGATITCGQSIGGWGRRETPVEWSGEVCPKCYEEYTKITAAIISWLDKRNGQRAPNIIIQENDVSVVQEDKPSSAGRNAPLLR
jgi:hypothetical protein